MANQVGAVILALVLALSLAIGLVVVDQVGQATQRNADLTDEEYDAARLDEGADVWYTLNDGYGYNETVWKTTGFAINLTGAEDSFVESKDSVTIADDDDWSVSTWAKVDSNETNSNMTAVSADGRVLIQYLDGNWSAWYYDEGDRNSWRVNVSAANQPDNLELITATSNGTHFEIYRNTTQGEVVNVTSSNFEESTLNTTNWNGLLEETRTFDDYTNDSEQATLHSNPIAARADRNRTTRLMYDQPGRPQVLLFTSTTVTYSNATFASGFPAQVMDSSGLLSGDYEWDETGPRIRPLSGGELDGFPVAYASYTFESDIAAQLEGIADAFQLGAIIPIVIVAGLVLAVISKFG